MFLLFLFRRNYVLVFATPLPPPAPSDVFELDYIPKTAIVIVMLLVIY